MCVCVTGVCGGTQKAWDQIAWLSLSNVNSTRKTTHVCAHIQTHTGWIKRWSRGIFFKTFVCPGLLLIVRWESFSHCTPTQAVSQKSREARHKGLNWAWTCHFYVLDRCKTCQIMQKRKIEKKDIAFSPWDIEARPNQIYPKQCHQTDCHFLCVSAVLKFNSDILLRGHFSWFAVCGRQSITL